MAMNFVARLEQAAIEANRREQDYRRQAAAEIARLEADRAYVHRRMNVMKQMVRDAQSCENAEEARKAQLTCIFRDIGWIGASLDELDESGKEAAGRLAPAADAVYLAVSNGDDERDHPDPVALFYDFETWFYERRGRWFLDAYETYIDDFMYPDA